jgi:NAD/NADP transhydrogenase beta subunit
MPIVEPKQIVYLRPGTNTSTLSLIWNIAGIDNPLFYKENTRMLFGDAKKTMDDLVQQLHSMP